MNTSTETETYISARMHVWGGEQGGHVPIDVPIAVV